MPSSSSGHWSSPAATCPRSLRPHFAQLVHAGGVRAACRAGAGRERPMAVGRPDGPRMRRHRRQQERHPRATEIMRTSAPNFVLAVLATLALLLGGCATRPINPPITQVDANAGYTFQTRQKHFKSQENLVVLAFSGGGTRASAFSYGVLEFLRRTEVSAPDGRKARL